MSAVFLYLKLSLVGLSCCPRGEHFQNIISERDAVMWHLDASIYHTHTFPLPNSNATSAGFYLTLSSYTRLTVNDKEMKTNTNHWVLMKTNYCMPSNHVYSCNCQRNAIVQIMDGLSKLALVVVLAPLKKNAPTIVHHLLISVWHFKEGAIPTSFSFFVHEPSLGK